MDEPTFQSKKWRNAAVAAFLGMNVGVLVFVATLPLTFLGMGALANNQELNDLALHCYSLRDLQYWLVGVGVLTLISETLALLATMKRNKNFQKFAIAFLAIVFFLPLILLVWGNIEHDNRKHYFQNAWTKMDDDTKHFLEGYFSCCGFTNETEWTSGVLPLNESCYAIDSMNITWPDGCYQRLTLTYLSPVDVLDTNAQLQTIGDGKPNPFFVSFIFSLTADMVFLIVSIAMLATAMASTKNTQRQTNSPAIFVIENISMAEHPVSNGYIQNQTDKKFYEDDFDAPTTQITDKDYSNGTSKELTNGKATDEVVYDKENIKTEFGEYNEKKSCGNSVGDYISSAFGKAFFWLGVQVGKHPKMTILYSLLLTGSFTVGIFQRYEPSSGSSSFLADDNPRVEEAFQVATTYIISDRDQWLLVVDETDVLSPENYLTALNIDISVKALQSSSGKNFSTICMNLEGNCKERSLFEFWSFNQTVLKNLPTADLLSKINTSPLQSPVFNDNVDISHILGGIVNDTGYITSAKAHLLHYVTTSRGGNWEELFIELGQQSYNGVSVYVNAQSSRSLEASSEYTKELPLLFAGFGLIFVYIMVMTGKLSRLEHRVYIALMGVVAAGLSMSAGIGVSSSFGLKWSVLHLIVPFLVIGIGVDDMFVLLQAWNAVEDDADLKSKPLHEKAGHALKNAGTSITVTSVTDLVAFAVGATSQLGGFASFSVFVAMCIILLFFLECTFFMACIVLDQRRRENRYDACLACCYKLDDTYEPGKCSERELFQTFFEDGLGRLVNKLPFAIIVILITLGLTGFMGWGFYNLPVKYDPDWYLPVNSYLAEFGQQYDSFFNVGVEGAAYVIETDFFNERDKLHTLYDKLMNNQNIDETYVESWFESYVSWAGTAKNISNVYATDAYADSSAYYSSVKEFLFTTGSKYIYDVVFRSDVIIGSKFGYRHVAVSEESDNIDIVESIKADCDEVGFNGKAFPYGRFYLIYEITRIIKQEVYRNLGITMLCVFIMVLPMLASLQMGFWVGMCVVFTTVDVAGTMHFAGLSIEASTIITLLLSVGLAVDYAAHVGHKFLALKGTRKMRIRVTMGQIGLAVFNGGFSTFLALVLLSGSDTYSYKVFFTVFSCVIGFGLWNGLIFLPCILGLIGPPANAIATEARLTSRHYKRKNKVRNTKKSKESEEIKET